MFNVLIVRFRIYIINVVRATVRSGLFMVSILIVAGLPIFRPFLVVLILPGPPDGLRRLPGSSCRFSGFARSLGSLGSLDGLRTLSSPEEASDGSAHARQSSEQLASQTKQAALKNNHCRRLNASVNGGTGEFVIRLYILGSCATGSGGSANPGIALLVLLEHAIQAAAQVSRHHR